MIKSFKGRSLDSTLKCRVYRNLHKQMWSVVQGGRVVAHATYLALSSCRFIVNRSGWKRMIKTGRRNVHAFVEGCVLPVRPNTTRLSRAGYHRRDGQFVVGNNLKILLACKVAVFDEDGLKVR